MAAIVPPSTLSPLIWLFANVKVPPEISNVPVVVNPPAVIVPDVVSSPLFIKKASSTFNVSPLKVIFVPATKFVSVEMSIEPCQEPLIKVFAVAPKVEFQIPVVIVPNPVI